MFSDQLECYQAIGSTLAAATKEPWASIKVEIALQGARVDAVVSYVRAESGETAYLTGVPMLARYFHELAHLVSSEGKGLYKRCVFTLDRGGRYDSQFVYD
jgi:hypothetical protein